MRALFALVSANLRKSLYVAAFIPILSWVYPAFVQASDGQNTALVFEVKPNQNQNSDNTNTQTQSLLSYDQIVAADFLVQDLRQYLQKKQPGSPLIDIADKIVTHPNWKRAVAISFVESNMCLRTPKVRTKNGAIESHNCSGMASGRKIYPSYEAWFNDMDKLLSQPNYVNRPLHKFLGYYVVPGSPRWLHGASATENDLWQVEHNAEAKRLALGQPNPASTVIASIYGIELASR